MSRAVFAIPMSVTLHTKPCVWAVRAKGKLTFSPHKPEKVPVVAEFDGWTVRDQFLSISSEAELLAFLARTGQFSPYTGQVWTVENVLSWQPLLKQLLTKKPTRWSTIPADQLQLSLFRRKHEFTTQFIWKGDQHRAIISCDDTISAMLGTCYIDHMRGARYRFCHRDDCGRQFELESEHERLYCSWDCGHVVACRNYRARSAAKKRGNR